MIQNKQLPIFHNKRMRFIGFCKMGYGPKKAECQDSYCIMDNINFTAVYDGHGVSGKEASQATNDYVQTFIERNFPRLRSIESTKQLKRFMQDAYKIVPKKLKNSGIDYSYSGTTAASFIQKENFCVVSFIGNTRVILYRESDTQKQAIELTYDHSLERPSELNRIKECNTQIGRLKNDENIEDGPLRVLGNKNKKFGLSITRSIGDFECEDLGIINDVEHFEFELCGYDKYVIVVSDGVWNVMNSDEICGFINEYRDKYELCELLLNECRERVYDRNDKNFQVGDNDKEIGCDDMSITIGFFNESSF